MTRQLSSLYLWIAPFLTIPVGQLRNLAGVGALIVGYVVFVAITAAAIRKIATTKAEPGVVRGYPTFLPGALLLAGPLALLLGASVTGEPTAAHPGDYLLNTTAILVGSTILISGFVALFARLWETGQRLLPVLGISALLVGSAVWLANLIFRYAVVASGAAGAQARVEDRAWRANEYLLGLRGEPSWTEFVLVWTDMLQLAFVLLAYLAAAALGASSVRSAYLGKVGGSIFVALNLSLAAVVTMGIVMAGTGNAIAAWTAFILTAPFMVFILPYFAGVALIRHGVSESRAHARTAVPA
jgi:hypothetical protein